MDEREKVTAAMECYTGDTYPGDRCKYCPYGYGYLDETGDNSPFWWCNSDKIMGDAIELLKAQDAFAPEPKEVIYDNEHMSVYCPSCDNRLAGLTHNGAVALETEEIPSYCWMCGQAVKWE